MIAPRWLRPGSIGLSLLVIGCTEDGADSGGPGASADPGGPAVELPMPDLEGVDLDEAFAEALSIARSLQAGPTWKGHLESLETRQPGCPDLYLGAPMPLVEEGSVDEGAGGLSWYDDCTTAESRFYRGLLYWESTALGEGDPETATGRSLSGQRRLLGTGVTGDSEETGFQLQGEVSDQLSLVEAPDYRRWSYSSTVAATVSGSAVFDPADSLTPGGWRAELYTSTTGGDADTMELRGDVYLFEHRIQGSFDSLSLDLRLIGPVGVGPDDCTLEPRGWIGLRDENAYWIDVVFMPREGADPTGGGYEDEEYSACDGCGRVYVRGIESEPLGEICPDFESLWSEGPIELPTIEDYALDLRGGP